MDVKESGFLTLGELLSIIAQGKKILLWSVSTFFFISILYLVFTTHKYVAEIHIGPNENALSQYSSRSTFPSLAGAAGLFGGAVSSGDYAKMIDLLTSQLVTRELFNEPKIVQAYFPAVWDEETAAWHPPSGAVQFIKSLIKKAFHRSAWTPPNAKQLSDIIKKDFFVNAVGETRLKKISYANKDPEIAQLILMKTLDISDKLIKKGNLSQVVNNIAYLESRLVRETLVEVKKELASQLVSEEKKKLALESELPYTYNQVGDFFIDESPTKPGIGGVLSLGLFAGLFFGLAVVFVRYSWMDNSRQSAV